MTEDRSSQDGSHPVAVFRDLCIDAVDVERMSRFWAAALGLERSKHSEGVWSLSGPSPQHGVWVNHVPEPVIVKQRVHIDVHAGSVGAMEALGATRLPGKFPWTLMRDPEGGELCVFVREEPPGYRLYEVVVDAVEPAAIATWWAGVLGAQLVHDDRGFSYLAPIPGAPFDSFDFVPVPEPRTVKNRIHWDVTGSVDSLLAAGASLLRAPDSEIDWSVLADPEGNEFCVFTP
jgi:catechol 2,3-dioxygenase-like lactoylglutathione lyase family enzyme